jgi:hypothetical protein
MIYKVNADNVFLMGSTHKVCQDYTLSRSFNIPIPYAIISDGCSSSEHTDIGARILTIRALHNIQKLMHLVSPETADAMYELFGYSVINEAREIVLCLGLPLTCLDATLIISAVVRDHVYTFMYGDGVIMSRKKSGECFLMTTEFMSNAPYYLSYWIDAPRKEGYKKEFGGMDTKMSIYSSTCDHMKVIPEFSKYDHKFISVDKLEDYQDIIIGSDGLISFTNSLGMNLGEPNQLLTFLEFKNTTGEFLKRRVLRVTKDWNKFGTQHTDDLSLAGFHIEVEK